MAKRKKSRNQQMVQEDANIKELLMELQAIEERRQCAVRFHQLMHQRCHLEIPIQYERLWRRSPPRPEESTHDHCRGTQQSRRRRLSHAQLGRDRHGLYRSEQRVLRLDQKR
jgi:hypothetical protein